MVFVLALELDVDVKAPLVEVPELLSVETELEVGVVAELLEVVVRRVEILDDVVREVVGVPDVLEVLGVVVEVREGGATM